MKLHQTQRRTIRFRNLSVHLPIFINYKKIPFIEIRPKFLALKPQQSGIVEVDVTPAKFGTVKCNIEMELLFYNQPRYEFQGYVPIGQVSVGIKFTTPCVTTTELKGTKSGKKEIAPSNIIELNLKGVTNEQYIKNNPVINRSQGKSAVSKATSAVVKMRKSYTTIALEKKQKAYQLKRNKTPEYEVDIKGDCCHGKIKSAVSLIQNDVILNGICPLTPNQMNNVAIEPKHLNIGRVAAYSKITSSFKIINKNDIPITVSIVPEKQRFEFPDGANKRIEPREIAKVPFHYFSEFEGFHSFCIRIVVSQNHVYDVTLQAQVVPRALDLQCDSVSFGNNEILYGFISVRNTLNIPLAFRWDVSNSSCIVIPKKGSVAAGKDMTCSIEFNEKKIIPTLQDISLVTENVFKSRVYVATKSPKLKLELSTNVVKFGYVPLNDLATRCLVLKNDSNIALEFKVANPTPCEGMNISPKLGRIPNKGIMIFKIILQAKRHAEIDSNINLIFNQTDYVQFRITARILLPKIAIRPTSIHFQKIPTSSYDTAEFFVHNKGHVASNIRFPEKKLLEWRVLRNLADNVPLTGDLLIEPKANIKLYIQYTPLNITNHWFYLPVIINGCIGDVDELYSLPSRSKLREVARAHNCIPNLKLFNVAYEPSIEISTLQCNFVYYPYNPEKSVVTDKISILNVSRDPIKICLKLEQLGDFFKLVVKSEHEYILEEGLSLVFTLESDEEIILTASYHSENEGKHSCRVPIYIHKDFRENAHNYIILMGYYQQPLMETDRKIYFGMLPLNIHVQKQVVIKKTYHNAKKCKVSYEIKESDNLDLSWVMGTSSEDIDNCSTQDVLIIKYSNSKSENSLGRIIIKCSCGCSCTIQVLGCMENSILTNYGYMNYIIDSANLTNSKCSSGPPEDEEVFSIAVMEDVSPFPFFPNKHFENQRIFIEAITAVEDWIFDFASCGLSRHLVPESLRYVAPATEEEIANGKEYYPVVTYMELLEVLVGEKIMEGFNLKCPIEPIPRVLTLQCLYVNILKFLLTRGGAAPHISPEFLLDYEEYVIYMRHKGDVGVSLTLDDFNSISKQCWLDLLLQTLKVFIISRIKARLISDNLANSVKMKNLVTQYRKSMVNIEVFYRKTNVINQNYFSTEEGLLLKWLEYHYFTNILSLCESPEYAFKHRFDSFKSALIDSIVLATVIYRYCPYLKEHLMNLYWKPILPEEYFHNAAKVLQTLMKVNNCFTIYPEQLCGGYEIKKLLFVAYLYEFLPTLEPIETIECKAPLSQSARIKISIKNESDVQREYKALLFGDTAKAFQLNKPVYIIEPHSVSHVDITYTAKFVKPVWCTLLLSGEMRKKRVASSICYMLNGIPDITYMTSTFFTTVEQFSFKYFTIEVQSPFKAEGTFEIFYSKGEPTDSATLEIMKLSVKIEEFQVGKVNSFVSYLEFDTNGVAPWTLLTMAISLQKRNVYIYLHNDVFGDFALKIEVTTLPCKRYEELQVYIPSDIHKRHCICYTSPNINCVRYIKIKIPRVNNLLRKFFYDAYYEIFLNTKQNLDLFYSPNGHRIIDHLFKLSQHETPEMAMLNDIITKPVTFNVTLSGETRENVGVPETFRIEHVDRSGTDVMSIHVDGILKDGLMLYLRSLEGCEVRTYKLKIEEKKQYKKIDYL